MLGLLLNSFPNRRRSRTRVNIAVCLPELSANGQRIMARRAMINLGRTTLETAWLWFGPERRVRNSFALESGAELLHAARRQGKGVILIAPHLNWEAAVLFTGLQGPSTFLYKPQKPSIEPLLRCGRGRFGTEFVLAVPGNVRRQLENKLAAQNLVLLLPDQDPRKGRGVFAPFFNVPAHTPTLVSRLAHTSGAPVLLLQAERKGRGGFGFRILPPPPGINCDSPVEGATAVNLAMEICIRPLVDQYMWSVPRFRSRPQGQPPIYGS